MRNDCRHSCDWCSLFFLLLVQWHWVRPEVIDLFVVGLVIALLQLTCLWVKQIGRRVKLLAWLVVR